VIHWMFSPIHRNFASLSFVASERISGFGTVSGDHKALTNYRINRNTPEKRVDAMSRVSGFPTTRTNGSAPEE
jgi:hypothetical protein